MGVVQPSAHVPPSVGPGVPGGRGWERDGSHGLGRRHHSQVQQPRGGGLLPVGAVHIERPGLVLLGCPEGAGARQRNVCGTDVLAARIGAFARLAGAEVGEQPPQHPAQVQVVVRVIHY